MKRLALGGISIIAILVVGCSSFNNSFNTYTYRVAEPPTKLDLDDDVTSGQIASNFNPPPATPAELPKAACDISPFFAMPATPEIPTKALQDAKDVTDIERIERRHIDELRKHISEIKRRHRQAQLKFYEKCSVIGK